MCENTVSLLMVAYIMHRQSGEQYIRYMDDLCSCLRAVNNSKDSVSCQYGSPNTLIQCLYVNQNAVRNWCIQMIHLLTHIILVDYSDTSHSQLLQ